MLLIYLFHKLVFGIATRVYFKKIIAVGGDQKPEGATIYVSNHVGSFMDPIIVGTARRPFVFFLVRADVFNRFTTPIFTAFNMLPIYRQRDGVENLEKNQQVFQRTNKLLANNKNILIFGEGFTSDQIQRRLHPLKKGAARIGFSALQACAWSKTIYLEGIGLNYTDFNSRGSEVLLLSGQRICLNDYREDFEQNPSKTISVVTKLLENDIRGLLPHVQDATKCDLHENIMIFARKGLAFDAQNSRDSLPLRWDYAKHLAEWMNSASHEESLKLSELQEDFEQYQQKLKDLGISEKEQYALEKDRMSYRNVLKLAFLFPFAFLGLLHFGFIHFFVKRWVEKAFKRKVFWGSTKLAVGLYALMLLNIPLTLLVGCFLPHDLSYKWVILGLYYLSIGFFAFAYLKIYDFVTQRIRRAELRKINRDEIKKDYLRIQEKMLRIIPNFNYDH